jgi:twitching motility protein PilT
VPQIDALFDKLMELKGSDLHLGVRSPPMGRVRGELIALRDTLVTADEMQQLLFEITDEGQTKTILENWDLDFAYQYGDKARFRANYFYKETGLAAVFRTIPSKVLTLEDLKTPEIVRKLSERRAGLILVTGPTGSGKSTTLAGMINHINRTRPCHVLTIEDPIEFVHEPMLAQITHREVGPHASSFANAIRSAGRENPDVILIGELRTNETIINAFPTDEQPQIRGMLSESLVGIVAQQLIKTADGKGRCAAQEIMLGSHAVAAMIRENKTFQLPSLIQAGKAQGMQTMDMALERYVRDGLITPQSGLEKAEDKDQFKKLFPVLMGQQAEGAH